MTMKATAPTTCQRWPANGDDLALTTVARGNTPTAF